MSRLDDYRTALLVASPGISGDELGTVLDAAGPQFPQFIIDHGLGPLWHERTGREEFHASRMQAEALFAMQEKALADIDAAFTGAGIDYVVIKGAANRLLLYDNPAVRACHDIDLLVRPEDRLKAATVLAENAFVPIFDEKSVSRELVMRCGNVDIDLHWGLLREGRLRRDPAADILARRHRVFDLWAPNSDDTLFALLVHPAFAKHLAGWVMGLHRVADLLIWIRTQEFDWGNVCAMLRENGVVAAAWATLRWAQLLSRSDAPPQLQEMLDDLQPGSLRQAWLEHWLDNDLPGRASTTHWLRLLGFTTFLHDTAGDALRAASGRWRARGRREADLAAFRELPD
jgi:hypothetical protein